MDAFIIVWIICAVLGLMIGSAKGRGGTGFVLGLLFGVIGLIIVAVMKPTPEFEAKRNHEVHAAASVLEGGSRRECPWCAESIQSAAKVCRYCSRDVDPVATYGSSN